MAFGSAMIVTNEAFKNTPYLVNVVMGSLNEFPQFYSCKSTLENVSLYGWVIHCIDETRLAVMSTVRTFTLRWTFIALLPHSGCSNDPSPNRTLLRYFKSLRNITVYSSKLERLPSLHSSPQLVSMILHRNHTNIVDEVDIPQFNTFYEWKLYRGRLSHFPKLTSLGDNNSLTILRLSENRISSIPCFPNKFKLNYLASVNLNSNEIIYICNPNLAPNITFIYLNENPLIGITFMDSTNVPLLNLYHFMMRFNNVDLISDAALSIIPNRRALQMDENNIRIFSNIKPVVSRVPIQYTDDILPEEITLWR